jgi:plastocyanin domain-containing protein
MKHASRLATAAAVLALTLAVAGCGGQQPAQEAAPPAATESAPPPASGEVAIQITDRGFEPARPAVRKGEPVTLVFTRTTEQTCATDVMFPRLGTHYDLPMNTPVRVEIPAGAVQDTLYFACGMNMITGMVVGE